MLTTAHTLKSYRGISLRSESVSKPRIDLEQLVVKEKHAHALYSSEEDGLQELPVGDGTLFFHVYLCSGFRIYFDFSSVFVQNFCSWSALGLSIATHLGARACMQIPARICVRPLVYGCGTQMWLRQPDVVAAPKCGCGTQMWLRHPDVVAAPKCGCGTQMWLRHPDVVAAPKCGCGTRLRHPNVVAAPKCGCGTQMWLRHPNVVAAPKCGRGLLLVWRNAYHTFQANLIIFFCICSSAILIHMVLCLLIYIYIYIYTYIYYNIISGIMFICRIRQPISRS